MRKGSRKAGMMKVLKGATIALKVILYFVSGYLINHHVTEFYNLF